MAGLLDSFFNPATFGGQNAGLLDLLRQSQMQQDQFQPVAAPTWQPMAPVAPAAPAAPAGPTAIGGYQMPRIGPAAQFTPPPEDPAALPVNAQPAQGQLPAAAPQENGFFSFLNRVNDNFQNMGNGGSLVGAITGSSPTNQTAQYLVSRGMDPALAKTVTSDPSLLRSVLPHIIGSSEQKAPTSLGNGYIWNPATRKVEQAYKEPTAADKSAEEIKSREDALRARGLDPKDPKWAQFALSGKFPREDAQPLTATDKKAIMSAEDENVNLANTVDTLKRAKELNPQTFTGKTASTLGQVGTWGLPGVSSLVDEKTAKNTREFGQLMTGEAISAMSKTLKGATTDRELERFVEILADPSTPPDIRGRTIDRMLQLADRQKQLNDSRINDLRGGTYYKPGGGQPAAQPSGSLPAGWSVKVN